jgi:hypothetical protein
MDKLVHRTAVMMGLLLAFVLPTAAQIEVGDNTNLSLGGALSAGYSGTFGSDDGSTHGLDFGGYGTLSGSYYNPRFLAFNFQPYYRRSQSNSIYQSITNGSGLSGSVNLFSGSRFPGSIGYSRTYDTTGQFGFPGIEGITAHGNGQNFSVAWSALLPNKPTFNVNYSNTGGSSSVFGTDSESSSHSTNLTLQSTYDLDGFQLMGQYTRLSMDAAFPQFLEESGGVQASNSASNSLMLTAMHKLPLLGTWSMSWNRTSYDGNYQSQRTTGSNNGVVNDLNTTVALNPTQRFALAFGADYNDNIFGSLQQQLLEAGAPVLPGMSASSHTFSTYAQGSYSIPHAGVYGRVSHYEVALPDGNRGVTQVTGSGTFNYAHRLLGALTFSVGVIDTATQDGNSGANLIGSVSFLRRIGAWEIESDFGYSQQVQTLFAVYTTSMYRYDARVHRRFGGLYWAAGFNGSHSGLTQYDGFGSRHEGFTTSLQYRRYGINGQYSQSSGSSILTPTGLVEVPEGVPLPLLQQPIVYGGKSYGGGASYSPFRRCIIAANYNKAYSNTVGGPVYSAFDSNIANARLQYRLRKLDVDFNYTRFQQSITTGSLPAVINSYYFRFTRSFHIF